MPWLKRMHRSGASCGVDYSHRAIERCRNAYPSTSFVEGDFTDWGLLQGLGQFEVILFVNALHEVFSSTFSPELGEVDVLQAKKRVEQALAGAAEIVTPGGYLVLFRWFGISWGYHAVGTYPLPSMAGAPPL